MPRSNKPIYTNTRTHTHKNPTNPKNCKTKNKISKSKNPTNKTQYTNNNNNNNNQKKKKNPNKFGLSMTRIWDDPSVKNFFSCILFSGLGCGCGGLGELCGGMIACWQGNRNQLKDNESESEGERRVGQVGLEGEVEGGLEGGGEQQTEKMRVRVGRWEWELEGWQSKSRELKNERLIRFMVCKRVDIYRARAFY